MVDVITESERASRWLHETIERDDIGPKFIDIVVESLSEHFERINRVKSFAYASRKSILRGGEATRLLKEFKVVRKSESEFDITTDDDEDDANPILIRYNLVKTLRGNIDYDNVDIASFEARLSSFETVCFYRRATVITYLSDVSPLLHQTIVNNHWEKFRYFFIPEYVSSTFPLVVSPKKLLSLSASAILGESVRSISAGGSLPAMYSVDVNSENQKQIDKLHQQIHIMCDYMHEKLGILPLSDSIPS